MEIILGFTTVFLIFFILLFASIRDVQTNTISNWVWIAGLFGFPIAFFRMALTGFLLPYGLQSLFVFILVTVGFRVGLMGGADGKAILLISFTYPWIILDFVWLFLAPLFVLLGGFLLIGLHSLVVLILNLFTWKRITSNHETFKPERRIFWVTRRLEKKETSSGIFDWNRVIVPLILYFLISYLVLLILASGPLFIPS